MEMPTTFAAEIESEVYIRVLDRAELVSIELLPSRERDVVKLVLEGATNAEIAARLGISLRTTRDRLCRVFRKLGVRNRKNLMAVSMFAERPHAVVTAAPPNLEKTHEPYCN
jgi:DNA-binding NarL/FixJ family response regulator